jgi:hypothetical protein
MKPINAFGGANSFRLRTDTPRMARKAPSLGVTPLKLGSTRPPQMSDVRRRLQTPLRLQSSLGSGAKPPIQSVRKPTPSAARSSQRGQDPRFPLGGAIPSAPQRGLQANRAAGLAAHRSLASRFAAKGISSRTEQVVRPGKGGSRIDTRIPTRSLESKSIDLTRPTYTKQGSLRVSNVKQAIRQDLKQAGKHQAHLSERGIPNQGTGKPLRETVVYSIKSDSHANADKFRDLARREGRQAGIKVGTVGTPVEMDPRPTGTPGYAGNVLLPMARKVLGAGLGWDLEAREQYQIFTMSGAQQAELSRQRQAARSDAFYVRLAQTYARNGYAVSPQELRRRAEATPQPAKPQESFTPARPDARDWIVP